MIEVKLKTYVFFHDLPVDCSNLCSLVFMRGFPMSLALASALDRTLPNKTNSENKSLTLIKRIANNHIKIKWGKMQAGLKENIIQFEQ